MVSRGKVGNSQHFPTNLHILLDEADKANHSHIVCWCSQGQSFKILDQEALVPLLAKYFRQTKFKSFLRQLQSYGFHRTTRGVGKGTVSHPFFLKGRRSMCFRMTRKPTGSAAAATIAASAATASAASATLNAWSNLAIPRLVSSSSIHRQASASSCNLVCRLGAALPNNVIQPVRKIHSEPAFHKNGVLSLNGGFTEISKLKNKSFDVSRTNVEQRESGNCSSLDNNRHHSLNNYLPTKLSSGPPTRRFSSATAALLYSQNNSQNKNNLLPPPMRRTSDPNPSLVVTSDPQRDSILSYSGPSGIDLFNCPNVNYSRAASSTPGRRQIPRESMLVPFKESSAGTASCTSGPAPNQVPSQHQQQQGLFQVQVGQHQDRSRVPEQQQRLQLQHHIHPFQYQQQQHQEQEKQQVQGQYQAEQERRQYLGHVKVIEYQLAPQHQGQHQAQADPQQHDPKPNPQAEHVYSHQEQYKQSRLDLEKNYRDQYEQNQSYCSSDTLQRREYRQQELPHPFQEKVHQCKQVQYHPDHQHTAFVAAPRSHACKLDTQQSSELHEALLDNFELSFSTAEFTNGTTCNTNTTNNMEASAHAQSHETNGNVSSFTAAISTPATTFGNALRPPVSTISPLFGSTTTQLDHTPRPRTQTVVSASFSLQQQHHQNVDPVQHQQHSCCSMEAHAGCDTIDEGTVDFLLQTGTGGSDEWEMRTEEVAEGLNYYGFLNGNNDTENVNDTTEAADAIFSDLSIQCHHHINNPMPVHVGPSSGPRILQSSRQ